MIFHHNGVDNSLEFSSAHVPPAALVSRFTGEIGGQVGGDVSPGVQDAPDVDAVGLGHVEDEVGKLLERTTPQLRDLEFEREAEGAAVRIVPDMLDGGLQGVHEVECRLRVGFVAVVVDRSLDVDDCKGAKVGLHRLKSGLGVRLVPEGSEVGGVCGAGDRGAASFEERVSEPAAVVVPADQLTHVLTRRSVVAKVDLRVHECLEFVREGDVHRRHARRL